MTIPAGLAPGQSVPYQTSIQIPSTPVPDVSSTGGTLYIAAWVNPTEASPRATIAMTKTSVRPTTPRRS